VSESIRVLVVEDNPANQLLAASVLEREGIEVDLAGTASEATECMNTMLPALILMDLQLPGQNGLDFTRQLKANPTTAVIPIVALTANAMNGDREMALAAGCDGYISKPIDTRTFGALVRQYLAAAV
jgi:two-component system, cell cycle response regulator DivK